MPSPGSYTPCPGESHLQGNLLRRGGDEAAVWILAPQTVAARSPHSLSGQADSCPGQTVPGASEPSWQRREIPGGESVQAGRECPLPRVPAPRATCCPCGWWRGPIPGALSFLKLVQIFHITFQFCSRKSTVQQVKVPVCRPWWESSFSVPVSGGLAHCLTARASLTTGWAQCGTLLGRPGPSVVGAGKEGAVAGLGLNCWEPLYNRVTFWAATGQGIRVPGAMCLASKADTL